jgi:hypothetical protein
VRTRRENFSELGYAISWRTPGITRRPERLKVDDKQCVGGRVHAVVMRRPTPAETRWRREYVTATRPARSAHVFQQDRRITPGITRRPARFVLHDRQRVGGRVHAVVGRGLEIVIQLK